METRFPVTVDAREISEANSETLKKAAIYRKQIEDDYKKFSAELLKSMEAYNILGYKDENITITYVSESEDLKIDEEKLKEKYPEAYEDCLVVRHKKSSIRIFPKKDN